MQLDHADSDFRAGLAGEIVYRAALASDSRDIARFICMAGEGLYEFLFDDLIPFVTAPDVLAMGTAGEEHPISYRNCHVAVARNGGLLVGAVNAFPADLVGQQSHAFLPADRRQHVRPMLELQDWGSMFVNALAVDDDYRGRGIGTRLLGAVEQHARSAGFDRLSLHVWADNLAARKLYSALGFLELGIAAIDPHPRLVHVGGSILMSKTIGPRRRSAG
jgi:GNAT superfamily N-acetyltransferase